LSPLVSIIHMGLCSRNKSGIGMQKARGFGCVPLCALVLEALSSSTVALATSPKPRAGRFGSDSALKEAVAYTWRYRPNETDGVSKRYVKKNAKYALRTRKLPYADEVPSDMFFRYVLPYSHFDEPVDDWRKLFYDTLLDYVKSNSTLEEAASSLWPVWFHAFGKEISFKADQTPGIMAPITGTLKHGFASCTGLSIFLANCYRAVGIPARIVGVREWNLPTKGNHNWVEVWTGKHWNFVDAAPSKDPLKWNSTWFAEQAKLQENPPIKHAILSPLWGPEANTVYALNWREDSADVPAIDLTGNYRGHGP